MDGKTYVLLDKDFSHRAVRNIDSFKRSKIGLGFVDEMGDTIIEYDPGVTKPFNNKFYEKINNIFEKQC